VAYLQCARGTGKAPVGGLGPGDLSPEAEAFLLMNA